MKKLAVIPAMALAGILFLNSCAEQQEESINHDFCAQLDAIDLKMLNLIKEIEEKYKADKAFIKAFKDAQVYWVQYRNRHVKAIFPLSPRKYAYDVGECKCEVYRDLTQDRVKQLQKWVEGVDEDKTCKGSYHQK